MLAAMFPSPMPLRIAGRIEPALPLRVRDLGTLAALAEQRLPAPDAGLDDLDRLDEPARGEALKAMYDACESWPPDPGSDGFNLAVFGSIEGRAMIVLLVLRARRDITLDEALQIAQDASDAERGELYRIAFGGRVQARFGDVIRRIDRHLGLPECDLVGDEPEERERIPWGEAIAQACARWHCTPEAIGDMPLTQWHAMQAGGKASTVYEPLPRDPGLEDLYMDRRAEFWHGPSSSTDDPDPESEPEAETAP